MLTEHEVLVEWRRLFRSGDVTAKTIRRAQALLGELPHESPLRFRLGRDLADIEAAVDSGGEEDQGP